MFHHTISAQNCASNESEVIISILTDNYAYETGWNLSDVSGNIYNVVNQDDEQTAHKIENGCIQLVGIQNTQFEIKASLTPNPLRDEATLSFPNPKNEIFSLKITDATGRVIQKHEEIRGSSFLIKRENMESGIYFYYLENEKNKAVGKVIIY